MKSELSINDLISDESIESAINALKCRSGSDNQENKRQLKEYWYDNCMRIRESILKEEFTISPITMRDVVSRTGKKRTVSSMNESDKMIARAVPQAVTPYLDTALSESCYSYRQNIGTKDLVKRAVECIENGDGWVVEIDIKDYFGSIPHKSLMKKLEQMFTDRCIVSLIRAFIECTCFDGENGFVPVRGLVQGSPLSPILSNIYLSDFDRRIRKSYKNYFRYGDDIRIYVEKKKIAEDIYAFLKKELELEELGINTKKSGVFEAIKRPHFGYELLNKNGHILFRPIQRSNKEVYHVWHSSSLKEIDHHYHIVSNGVLSRKDFALLFENESGKKHLPVEAIESLNIYSNVVFSSSFFDYANSEKLIVNLIDRNGNSVGRFVPENYKRSIQIEASQLAMLADKSQHLKLGKVFQNANVFNLRAILRYYERRSKDTNLKNAVCELTEIIRKINESRSIESLMIYEAQARQVYYRCFNSIIQTDSFKFVKRTRRPPQDAINALISFGNTLLYNRFASEIYQSSLDIRFGIVHNSKNRAESLNLDLADLFKPILVDRTIFTLINRKMINAVQDFEESHGGIYLSERGKRIFINEFDSKLSQTVNVNGRKRSYSDLLKAEVKKVQKYFSSQEKYKPFKYVN